MPKLPTERTRGREEWIAKPGDSCTSRAVLGLWNDTLLIERIASGRTPDDDPALSDP